MSPSRLKSRLRKRAAILALCRWIAAKEIHAIRTADRCGLRQRVPPAVGTDPAQEMATERQLGSLLFVVMMWRSAASGVDFRRGVPLEAARVPSVLTGKDSSCPVQSPLLNFAW